MYCRRTGLPTALASTAAVRRAVVGVVAAVAAGPGIQHHMDVGERHAELRRKPDLHEVRLLRAGPAVDLAVLDLDHRAGRSHAGVRLERPFVLGLDHARGGLERLVDVAVLLVDLRSCAPAPCGCGRRARSGPGTAARPCDHSTLSFSAALIASHSLSATTPRKPLSQTTCAPGMSLIELSSTFTGTAPATGGPDHAAVHHARHLDVGDRSPPARTPSARRPRA